MHWENALDGYWLARRRSLSKATVLDYNLTFRRFGIWIKNAEIETIKPAQVNAFLTHLDDDLDLAPKTILNAWIALSAFWTWATAELGVPHILRDVVRPRPHPHPMQPYTEDEVRRLIAATARMKVYDRRNDRMGEGRRPTQHRDIAILIILLDAGLRVSELCALQLRHYDRKSGRLLIEHGKGDKPRVVYIGQSARKALWRYLADRPAAAPTAPLIASSRADQPLERAAVQKLIARLGQRAGVVGATPHRFRHTFAVNFLRNGGNMAALQDLLGHSTLEMVRRYARLAEVDLADAQKIASPADKWHL